MSRPGSISQGAGYGGVGGGPGRRGDLRSVRPASVIAASTPSPHRMSLGFVSDLTPPSSSQPSTPQRVSTQVHPSPTYLNTVNSGGQPRPVSAFADFGNGMNQQGFASPQTRMKFNAAATQHTNAATGYAHETSNPKSPSGQNVSKTPATLNPSTESGASSSTAPTQNSATPSASTRTPSTTSANASALATPVGERAESNDDTNEITDEDMESSHRKSKGNEAPSADGFTDYLETDVPRLSADLRSLMDETPIAEIKEGSIVDTPDRNSTFSSPSLMSSIRKMFSKPSNSPRTPKTPNGVNTENSETARSSIISNIPSVMESEANWEGEKDALLGELNRHMKNQAQLMSENDQYRKEMEEMRSIVETNQRNWQKLFKKQKETIDEISSLNLSLEQRVSTLAKENDRLVGEVEILKEHLNRMLQSEAKLLDRNISLFQLNEHLITEKQRLEKELLDEKLNASLEQETLVSDKDALLDAFNKLLHQQGQSDVHKEILERLEKNTLSPSLVISHIRKNPTYRFLIHTIRGMKEKMVLLDECLALYQQTCDWDLLTYCILYVRDTTQHEDFIHCFKERSVLTDCYASYLKTRGDISTLRAFYAETDNLEGELHLLFEDMFQTQDEILQLSSLDSAFTLCSLHESLQHHIPFLAQYRETITTD